METEERNQRGYKGSESKFLLQWGNRKRLRCVRLKDPRVSSRVNSGIRRKITATVDRSGITTSDKENTHFQPNRYTRNSEGAMLRSAAGEARKSASPEKEDRYYATRGSVGGDDAGKVLGDGNNGEERAVVWPKLYIALSSKEKEEDFLAMKGCKPPQRPKKRAKIIQRSLLLVSPGAWLSDMCQERYEVREKKSNKKRPRGLKAMGSMESDSE